VATLSLIGIAQKTAGPVASGLSLLLRRPLDLPRVFGLAIRWVWHVGVRRKRMLTLTRLGGLGDLLCVLACVPGLRRRHPNSWLLLIAPTRSRKLAISTGLPDATVEADSFAGKLCLRFSTLSTYYQPLLPDEHDPPQPQALHLAHEFARALGVKADLSSVSLRVPDRARRRMKRRLLAANTGGQSIVVLHPGPSWPVREWPHHRWCELTEIISARIAAIIIKIGMDLDSYGHLRPSAYIPNTVDWTNQLDVIEIAALLEQADLFVGIDSGPLHIAGVLGVPAVGLFGAISANLRLRPSAPATIITGKLDCLGCHHSPTGHLHWRTGCPNDIACMREITAKEVFAAVARYLEPEIARSRPGHCSINGK
jgi:ADP-heptose:LPS heptosyltransferase